LSVSSSTSSRSAAAAAASSSAPSPRRFCCVGIVPGASLARSAQRRPVGPSGAPGLTADSDGVHASLHDDDIFFNRLDPVHGAAQRAAPGPDAQCSPVRAAFHQLRRPVPGMTSAGDQAIRCPVCLDSLSLVSSMRKRPVRLSALSIRVRDQGGFRMVSRVLVRA